MNFLRSRDLNFLVNRHQHKVPNLFFFFSSRRRHTRFDCDWSSDVCSSDLLFLVVLIVARLVAMALRRPVTGSRELLGFAGGASLGVLTAVLFKLWNSPQIGRASCRERV